MRSVFGVRKDDNVRIVADNSVWPGQTDMIGKEAKVLETKYTLAEGKVCLLLYRNNEGWDTRMWWSAASLEVIDGE